MMRRFRLVRDVDETGVSGTGHVADGVIFHDGSVVMKWRTSTSSTTFFASMSDVAKVHGHAGKTRVEFIDPAEPAPAEMKLPQPNAAMSLTSRRLRG